MKRFFEDTPMRKLGANGFTLMEVMITVVIIAILASIAYPSYTRYVAETRRSDATINLTRIAALQEKFFTECGTYTDQFNGVISARPPAPRCTGLGAGPTAGSFTTADGYYTLTVTALAAGPAPVGGGAGAVGGGGYTLSAAPVPGTSQFSADNPKCTTITITNAGVKGGTGTDAVLGPNGGKCWKK